MEKLPKDARISTSSKDMIIQLCMTFLTSLSAKANNVCGAKNKKTVCPDHVIDAMVVSAIEKQVFETRIKIEAPSNTKFI